MRVAVLFDLSSPKSGGAYSFNKLIFDSLCRNKSQYKHDFLTVFDTQNCVGAIPDIALPTKLKYRVSFIKTVLQKNLLSKIRKSGISWEICRGAALNSIFKKNDIDVVWAVQPISVPLEIPYLTTSWDISHRITPYFPELSSASAQREKRDKICASTFSGAFRIIVGTNRGKQEIIEAYGVNPERLLVNPLPVGTPNLSPLVPRNSTQIIYPANFWPHKNHVILIQALKLLNHRSKLKIKLILTGSDKGSLEIIKSLVASLGLQDYVEFPGFISKSELDDLYSISSLLVFPSLIGPDNLPPLEALAQGCKIAVSDIPGAREQFGKFATYFDPYDVHDLADAIQYNLEDESCALNLVELSDFLEVRSAEHYVGTVVKEIEKLDYIIDIL